MAAFKFSKSEFAATTQEWGFESVGIFGKLPTMKGKKVTFTKRNLKGDKSVTLQIFPKDYATLSEAIEANDVEKLSCTKPLSASVRKLLEQGAKMNQVLSWLLTLEIQTSIENPEISLLFSEKGDGEALPAFLTETLAKEKPSYADLAAF